MKRARWSKRGFVDCQSFNDLRHSKTETDARTALQHPFMIARQTEYYVTIIKVSTAICTAGPHA